MTNKATEAAKAAAEVFRYELEGRQPYRICGAFERAIERALTVYGGSEDG